jgi:hypothetical protein
MSCVADRRSAGKKSTRGTGKLAAAVAPQVTNQYALVFNHSSNKDLRGCTLHELQVANRTQNGMGGDNTR